MTSRRSTSSDVSRANVMRPERGSSSTSSATASATLARIGATWNRSIFGTGRGVKAVERSIAQAHQGQPGERIGRQSGEALVRPDPAGEATPRFVGQRAEQAGDVLERLALQQAGQQEVALLPKGQLVVELDVGAAGEQPPGLQLDERGGDQQELGGDVEVERLHALDLVEVGVDDPGQADLVDVDLLGEDQLQEQVERTFIGPIG